jgi:hypothetical protein
MITRSKLNAPTYPVLPDSEWTKVTTLDPARRTALMIVNLDAANDMRYILVDKHDDPPANTETDAGLPLANGSPGGSYTEDLSGLTYCHVYVFQESGGQIGGNTLKSLFVQEG